MQSTYNKPFLNVDSQLDLLQERGLIFTDREDAYRQLQAIGYYRLSGYWYPFRKMATQPGAPRPSDFISGTSLTEVLEIYRFDERLRAELLHAISRIEVALRFHIGHLLGRRGQFAHLEASQLSDNWSRPHKREGCGPNCTVTCHWLESEREAWAEKQKRNEEVSNEAFIAHFYSNYGMPLPVWTATEVMTLGGLTQLFNGMTQRDRQQIAVELDVYDDDGNGDAKTLSSWLEHLRQTRNFCAHHARVWNRNHTAPLAVPAGSPELAHLRSIESDGYGAMYVSRAASRLYGTLTLVAYLLARVDHTNTMRDGLRRLVESFVRCNPTRLSDMGFPADWADEEIWSHAYVRDETLTERARLLRETDLLYTADAAALLSHKQTRTERHSRLNYYRKQGAVLSVPGVEAHRHPAFQFDLSSGDVAPLAILANRRLLADEPGDEQKRWAAFNWWTSPNESLPGGLSPASCLERQTLTKELLDCLLPPRPDE